jgi:uncharacterized membrane protein
VVYPSGGGIVKIRSDNLLLGINILSIILIVFVALLPSNVLRIVLGLPFILFFPGYTLLSALFPRRDELGGVARIALSFGLSIAIAPLVGLIANYTPWGIGLYPILVGVAVFIFVTSVVAWYRRSRLSDDESLSTKIKINFTQWKTISVWNKALPIVLVVLILGSIGTLAYAIVTPKQGEKFTEFYVLGQDGKAEGYPTELSIGETGEVILGIINHEGEDNVVYSVELCIDGALKQTIGPLTLADEEKWESEVSFTPNKIGQNQKVEFKLYRQGEDTPYKVLYLWIDVS